MISNFSFTARCRLDCCLPLALSFPFELLDDDDAPVTMPAPLPNDDDDNGAPVEAVEGCSEDPGGGSNGVVRCAGITIGVGCIGCEACTGRHRHQMCTKSTGAERQTHATVRLIKVESSPRGVVSLEADDVFFYCFETKSDIFRGTRD
jgi:hypothetical protein